MIVIVCCYNVTVAAVAATSLRCRRRSRVQTESAEGAIVAEGLTPYTLLKLVFNLYFLPRDAMHARYMLWPYIG